MLKNIFYVLSFLMIMNSYSQESKIIATNPTPTPPIPLCFNDVSTNPENPRNPQFPGYLNRFNWQNNSAIPYNTPNYPNTYTPNPFYGNQTEFYNIVMQQDFKVENGWEVIAYNLGYDQNNVALNSPPQNSYFLMYNKHRGILRVLVKWSDSTSSYNQALITLQFSQGFQSNLLDMTTYEKPLLAQHIPNPKYSTAVRFFNGVSEWAYADFKVNYDPCTCKFTNAARMRLYTNLIQNSSISLTGSITGTISSVKDGMSQGTQDSSGKFWKDVDGLGKTFVNQSKNISGFIDTYEKNIKKLEDANIKLNAFTKFGEFLKKNDFLKTGLSAAPDVGSALSLISSFFGGGAGATQPSPIELGPMAVDLSVKLSGNISTEAPMHNFDIGLPGASNSNVVPGIQGGQPLYNEPLGVFSLIDEPTMYYKDDIVEVITDGGILKNGYQFTYRTYKMNGDKLRYAINPSSNLTLQDAEIQVVAEYVKPALGYLKARPDVSIFFTGYKIDTNVNYGLPMLIQQSRQDSDNNDSFYFNNNYSNVSNNLNTFQKTDVGNCIDTDNNIFQNAFPVIGSTIFKNNYKFHYLYDIKYFTKLGNQLAKFQSDFGFITGVRSGLLNPFPHRQPNPKYLAPRVKEFKLKLILNLKRTDNPNAQNVLYVVSYPVKMVSAPAGYNMSDSNYAIDAQMYRTQSPIHNSNILVPFTGDLQTLCNSVAYTKSRSQTTAYNRIGEKVDETVLAKTDKNFISDKKAVEYFPNPVTEELNLKLNGNKLINIVSSIDSRFLQSFENLSDSNTDEIKIDFKHFKSGLYFVNYLDINGNVQTIKIIKN